MVTSCCAYNCTQRYVKGNQISFHKFPSDPKMRKKWLLALRRENFQPSRCSVVCSKHFTEDSYFINPWSTQRNLRHDAIPSIFTFPEHLQKKINKRKQLAVRNSDPLQDDLKKCIKDPEATLVIPAVSNLPSTSTQYSKSLLRTKRYIGDFKSEEFLSDDPVILKQHFLQYKDIMKTTLKRKNDKIKILQQTKRRLDRRIDKLKSLVKILKNKKINNENSSFPKRIQPLLDHSYYSSVKNCPFGDHDYSLPRDPLSVLSVKRSEKKNTLNIVHYKQAYSKQVPK